MEDEDCDIIHKACEEGDMERVEQLLNEDPSLVHVKDSTEFKTPLFYACGHFQTDIVRLLLERGANVNEETPKKWTPLHELFLACGCRDLEQYNYRGSPYVLDTVKEMLQAGADPNVADVRGDTPWSMFISVGLGDVEVVKLLFDYGLDVTMKVDSLTVTRLSTKVSGYFHDDCVQLMELCLMYGGNVNEVDEEHGTLLHTLTECNGYSNSVDYPYNVMEYFLKKGFKEIDSVWKGYTAISLAARKSNLKTVILLLQHGARVDIDYPLHFLGCGIFTMDNFKKVWANYQIASILVQHGAKVNPDLYGGKETITNLLIPGNDPIKIKAAKKALKMIFRENAVLLPSRIGCALQLPCSTVDMLQSPNMEFIPYFYELGYRLTQINEAEKTENNLTEKTKQILKQIKEIDGFSLQAICRFHLRKILGSPLSCKVEKLPIPEVMKDYLYMKEMV